MSLSDFNSTYPTPHLEKDKLCFLMSDFIIDLMKIDITFDNSQFCKTIYSYFPLIHKPANSTEKSRTSIDDILFDSFEFTAIPCNTTHALFDHSIQFVILEDFRKPSSP